MKNGKRIFALLLALLLLTGCGGESGKSAGPVPLTEEEISLVNGALACEQYVESKGWYDATEVSCFFTSLYDSAESLNFKQFMRQFPSTELVLEQDSEEFAALAALPEFPFKDFFTDGRPLSPDALPVPTHRIREEAVNAALSKWAGITLDDIADKSGVCYLEEYHAFYTFTSDFGPGIFTCTGGEVDGGTARLWSQPNQADGRQTQLTLERRDGNWYIQSLRYLPTDSIN